MAPFLWGKQATFAEYCCGMWSFAISPLGLGSSGLHSGTHVLVVTTLDRMGVIVGSMFCLWGIQEFMFVPRV